MNSDQGFRAARKAGARGAGRLVLPLVFLALAAVLAQPLTSGDGSETSPLRVGVLVLVVGVGLVRLVVEVRRLARNRGLWGRAARGAVSLTLRGEAVAKRRNVSGRPMRTVVVQHGGERQYLHLLFAKGAPADTLRQGPVTVEFFAGNDVEGPARILLPDGRTLWAFTSRLGARPPVDGRRGTRAATSSSTDASAGAVVPAVIVGGYGVGDGPDRSREDPGPDTGFGDGTGESTWTGGDGWTGGGSWGSDSTWSGSDGGGGGGSWSGGDSGGGGWSGGDSGGGGGDSGGGGGS